MPSVNSRPGSRRRTINEINMVPFIDVMLVLLIIFMVSAPLMTPGVVELPSVGQAQRQPDHLIEVIIEGPERMRVRIDGKNPGDEVPRPQLGNHIRILQNGSRQIPVIIAADKGVQYEVVVRTMDQLQRAGVQRVGLAVRTTGV
jgi:biopolymer transport protein TolR